MNRTLIIIKPDGVKNSHLGKILARIESEGFHVLALRLLQLDEKRAKAFYAVHKDRPFYDSLVSFMTSGPIVTAVLFASQAVQKWRDLIGATDPADAAPNTIRKLYAESKERNVVHGSDSDQTAEQEISFFFEDSDLVG